MSFCESAVSSAGPAPGTSSTVQPYPSSTICLSTLEVNCPLSHVSAPNLISDSHAADADTGSSIALIHSKLNAIHWRILFPIIMLYRHEITIKTIELKNS